MDSAAEILVIILSSFLAIFLILGIILFIYLIILTRKIQKVADTAEKTVDNIESVVSGFSKMFSPIFVAEMFKGFLKKVKSYKRREK